MGEVKQHEKIFTTPSNGGKITRFDIDLNQELSTRSYFRKIPFFLCKISLYFNIRTENVLDKNGLLCEFTVH